MFKYANSKFNHIYRGKVLDNNDTLQLGRIKVEVYPMFRGLTATELPWATPAYSLWEGAGDGVGYFAVPKVDSFVFVFFEAGDFNSPVYFAEAQTALFGLPSFRTTNYPNRKGWKNTNGIEFYVDDGNNEIKLTHPAGTVIQIDTNGNIIITGAGATNLTSTGVVNITGSQVNLNP